MKTGAKTIITGIFLIVLGAFVIPLTVILSLVLDDSNEKQFKIPVTTVITIEEPGRYYLWNEYQTIFNGRSYNRSKSIPDGIEIKIKSQKTGESYNFISNGSISSNNNGSSRNSIGYVDIQNVGSIDIEISGGNEERIFSFSQFDLWDIFGLILGGIGLSMMVCLSGVGLTIWGIINVSKSNKKAKQVKPVNVTNPPD
jgi:hypothetical protein